jgi:DNA-binding transcriptional MerR regulator
MKMQKRLFRIGDLAEKLAVEKFVIRFWEKEFNFKTYRSEGGQRFYSHDDLEQFQRIKELLYDRGFTIAGAKREINKKVRSCGAQITSFPLDNEKNEKAENPLLEELLALKKQLLELRKLL